MLRKFTLQCNDESRDSLKPETYFQQYRQIYKYDVKDQDEKAAMLLKKAATSTYSVDVKIGVISCGVLNSTLNGSVTICNFNFKLEHVTEKNPQPTLHWFLERPNIAVICARSQDEYDDFYNALRIVDDMQNGRIINILLLPKGVSIDTKKMHLAGVIEVDSTFEVAGAQQISEFTTAIVEVFKLAKTRLELYQTLQSTPNPSRATETAADDLPDEIEINCKPS